MDMVESYDMLAFIPYTGEGKELQRRRELQLSKARSHAAQRSYAWRKPRQTQRQVPHADNGSSFVRSDSDNKPHQHRLTAGRRTLNRRVDWHFGSLGGTCRSVGDLDVTALQFYLRQPLSQTLSAEVVDRFHRPSAKLGQWSSFLQETVQRVTKNSAALDSLVASTVILMADNYMGNASLISAGREITRHAVSELRISIQANASVDPFSVQLSSLHLCLGALRAGDINATRTHLTFLEATVTELDIHDPYHVDYLSIVRFCDVWLALESGQAPSIFLHPHFRPEYEARLRRSEQPSSYAPTRSTSAPNSRDSEHMSVPPHQIPNSDAVNTTKSNSPTPVRRSHSGLFRAAESGLLSIVTPGIITNYAYALDYISESAQKETTTLDDFQPMVANCIESLCQLGFALQQIEHDLHTPTNQLDSNQGSPLQVSAVRSTDFDEPVALALQIQIVIRMGRFVQRNREKLSRRLTKALWLKPRLMEWTRAEKRGNGATDVLSNQLYLWVLLTGMLCAKNDSKELEWYRSRALRALAAMDITTEAQLDSTLEPFLAVPAPFDYGFRKLAQDLVGASAMLGS